MVEVNGLFYSCVAISHKAPAAHGGVRHSLEIRCVGLVAINNSRVHLLCFMYSLFVGSRRKSPRLVHLPFGRPDTLSGC
jgi:hypothetical protein